MFCPFCGRLLANPSHMNRDDDGRSFWTGIVIPSCTCGACLEIEAKGKDDVMRVKIAGVGKYVPPPPPPPSFVNCIATPIGDFPEFGLSMGRESKDQAG